MKYQSANVLQMFCVQLKTGEVFEGIFADAPIRQGQLCIQLKMARLTTSPGANGQQREVQKQRPVESMQLSWEDIACVTCKDIRMGADVGHSSDDFSTDAAISAGRGGYDFLTVCISIALKGALV